MYASKIVVVLALGLSALSMAVAAPSKGKNQGPAGKATESAQAVQTVRTAEALARYGDAAKDPLALITAAKMLKEAGASDSKAQRVTGKDGEAKNKPDAYSADAVLQRARTLAAGRQDLIALADDVAKTSSRGGENGPGFKRTVVGSGGAHTYRVRFRGGELARVLVSGDGDSDLDLYIYDENNNLICKDDDATDDMVCQWSPRWTGDFLIRVRNRGVANEYRIYHN